MTTNKALEVELNIAKAIQQGMAKALNATPAPGREFDPNSWTAVGGELDLLKLTYEEVMPIVDQALQSERALADKLAETLLPYAQLGGPFLDGTTGDPTAIAALAAYNQHREAQR